METAVRNFILSIADNSMILGQRLGEWCGHGPILEQDIALTNIALDLIGEARNYYQYLAEIEGKDEDDYPMKRDVRQFKNTLLTEQPNGHWGDTIVRQFLYDCFHYYFLKELCSSSDLRLAAIAKKSFKEVSYHLTFSSEWIIRLGDGTEESHAKIQQSLDDFMPYFDEMFTPSEDELYCINVKICPDLRAIKVAAYQKLNDTISEATLVLPQSYFHKTGGKSGLHSESLGFILAEMQYLQRVYPGATW